MTMINYNKITKIVVSLIIYIGWLAGFTLTSSYALLYYFSQNSHIIQLTNLYSIIYVYSIISYHHGAELFFIFIIIIIIAIGYNYV